MSTVIINPHIVQAAAGNPSAIVSGAGSPCNGTYTVRGTANGKPYYNLIGEADDPEVLAISWNEASEVWRIYAADTSGLYDGTGAVAFPWLASWDVNEGTPPAPTVTQS